MYKEAVINDRLLKLMGDIEGMIRSLKDSESYPRGRIEDVKMFY